MKQEIENVKLTLISSGGIRPMVKYSGFGKMDMTQQGFRFEEKKKYVHTRNVRISKKVSDGEDSIFYLVNDGRFRMTLYVDADECNLKAIMEKIKPLLKDAKEGGYV